MGAETRKSAQRTDKCQAGGGGVAGGAAPPRHTYTAESALQLHAAGWREA